MTIIADGTTVTSTVLSVDEPVAAAYAAGVARNRTLTGEALRAELVAVATQVRRDIVTTIQGSQLGHIGGDLSVTDILVTAYWHALRLDPHPPGRTGP